MIHTGNMQVSNGEAAEIVLGSLKSRCSGQSLVKEQSSINVLYKRTSSSAEEFCAEIASIGLCMLRLIM